MLQHFQTEQWLPYPPEQVFAFFADPANLPRLMPRWQAARIEKAAFVAPPPPPQPSPYSANAAAGSGTRLTLSFRPFPYSPVRLPWEALIEDFRWNQGFCDVQLRGPFRSWRHCHTVRPVPSPEDRRPGTLLRDAVAYELPLGPFSGLADRLFVRSQLTRTFRYRQQRTLKLLSAFAPK